MCSDDARPWRQKGNELAPVNNHRLIAYCGLYCGLCAQCCRIPQRAQTLQQAMRVEGYDFWCTENPGFEPFWRFLGGRWAADEKHRNRILDRGTGRTAAIRILLRRHSLSGRKPFNSENKMKIRGTDFVMYPVSDIARAAAFCRETLGLPQEMLSEEWQ